jgi:probable rRNA maturation factor
MIKIEVNQCVGKGVNKEWISRIAKIVFNKVNVKKADISIAFIDDLEMKKLNYFYRGKNKTTDVLTFIYESPKDKRKDALFGEVIISYPRAARQARKYGWGIKKEIGELLVHGLLHLCGFDHEKSPRAAKKMREMEQVVLEKI